MKLALAIVGCVLSASAAGIDGQWNAELSARGKKAAAPAQTSTFTLNFKTQDGQVTGSVAVAGKKKPHQQNIQNARLDGNRLTFKTVQTGKNKASVIFSWQVTVDGDRMTGTRTREGARRGVTFQARKSG